MKGSLQRDQFQILSTIKTLAAGRCLDCGKVIVRRGYRGGCPARCPECTREWNRRTVRAHDERRRLERKKPEPTPRVCPECHVEFTAIGHRIYCSDKCRGRANGKTHLARIWAEHVSHDTSCRECGGLFRKTSPWVRLCGACHDKRHREGGRKGIRSRSIPRMIVCAECGALASVSHPGARFCSAQCEWKSSRRRNYDPEREAKKNLRARARAAGVTVEEYVARAAETNAKISAAQERERREREWKRDYYPGGCYLPSKADAVRAGLLCRTCRKAQPTPGSHYCAECRAYHTLKSNEANKRKRLGYYLRRGWRDVHPSGPKKRDKDKEAQRLALFGWRCAWCGSEMHDDVTMDHVIPESSGGTNWPSNLVPACRTCNSSKSSRHPAEFVRWRMRKSLSVTRFAIAIANHYARLDPRRRGVPLNRLGNRERVISAH